MIFPLRKGNILISVFLILGTSSILVVSESSTPSPAINQYVCPSGFDLVTGQCRGFAQTETNWNPLGAYDRTVDICKTLNALPPIIRNAEDHSYWSSVNTSSPYKYIIIGIACNDESKKWQWVDGTEIDFRPSKFYDDLDNPCRSGGTWYYYNNDGEWYYGRDGNYPTIDIYCMTELKKPELRQDDCIQFDHDESDSMCYQVSEDPVYMVDAQDMCRSVGSNLASIHCDQENSFIRRLAVSRGLTNGVFLGATASGKKNKFKWLDGSEWNYTKFLPDFPFDGYGDCLAMDTTDINGEWMNIDCSAKLPFVCSRKPFTTSETCAGPTVKEGDIILTPGFPSDASTFCEFFLKVDPGKLVEVEILLLEANNCCDHFVLYEGALGGEVLANLTGAISGAKISTKTSNQMKASWQPNGGVNVRGAMFTFRAV